MWQRLNRRGLWLVVWSLCWTAASLVQASDPADAVPDSASIVVRWKSPQATLTKFADFVDVVQPGFGAVVNGSLPVLGNAIFVPQLTGVDVENDWWVIVFADSEEDPEVVFVIPATDAKAVEKALPDDFEFHTDGNLALYSKSEEALQKVQERLSGKGKAIWSKIDATSKKLFDASDISGLIHVRQLAETYKSELDEAEPKLNEFIDQITTLMPEAQRPQMTAAFDMYRTLGRALVQGVNDSDSLTFGLTVSKDAIRCEDRLQVKEGTQTAKFLANQPTGDLALISRLPGNKSMYVGAKLDIAGMIDWSMNLTKTMLPKLTDKQKTEFDAGVKQMKDLKYGEMAWYMNLDPKSAGAMQAGSVVDVTPTDRMRDVSRSLIKVMGTIETPAFTQTTTLEPAATKVGGVEVDRITIKQEVDSTADPLGIQKKFRDLLFGEEGMRQLVMYQPKRVLQTLGGGTTEMQKLVAALGSTTSNDATVVVTARKRLSEKANIIALVDLPQLIAGGIQLASKQGVIPIDAAAIEDLKLSPSFLGFSIVCEPTGVRSQFEIPVAQAEGIAKLVSLFMSVRR